ncbi:hypothetical protein DBP19_36420 [Streptomyces sp. CS090A]|uniref:hypothetical protein n=1 Tax=Streptomyces sp. CS090A TaxID=2162710 RepID=UPI000D507A2B|nr:hypothetical protein [Streptomyces sp. CS090A]PVC80626.1 hypothetical protein DBP19_36420 [Streptomyces sp. CS090A]
MLHEEDTTPIALTAGLIHEARRVTDAIAVGPAHAGRPWEDQSREAKARTIALVERARGEDFEGFYEFMTLAIRMAGRPVAPSTDTDNDLVRYARMIHAVVHALVPPTSG